MGSDFSRQKTSRPLSDVRPLPCVGVNGLRGYTSQSQTEYDWETPTIEVRLSGYTTKFETSALVTKGCSVISQLLNIVLYTGS